jgi:hypothetical protein
MDGKLRPIHQGVILAIKPWEAILAAAVAGGFFYFQWRIKSAASPDKLLGQVQEVRRKWLWALEAGRLLVIRHDTHHMPAVRLQFRKPGTLMALRLNPGEALRLAALVRKAAAPSSHPATGIGDQGPQV